MPTYLILAKTASNPIVVDYVTATDLAAAEAAVKASYGAGVSVGPGGVRDTILLGLIALDADGSITPDPNPANAVAVVTDNYRWQTISLASDQTVNNSVTLASTALTVAVAANTKYRIRGCAFLDTTAAADVKYSIVGPASPTLARISRTHAVPGVAPVAAILDSALPAAAALAGTGTTGGYVKWEMILHNGANAGSVVFQFAQNTQTNDTGAILRAGSYIEFARA